MSLLYSKQFSQPLSLSGSFTGSLAGTSSYATTASYAINGGGTVNTSSLLTTASVASNIITFTKGDGSTFPITVNTGSSTGLSGGNQLVIPVWTGTATLSTSSIQQYYNINNSIIIDNQAPLVHGNNINPLSFYNTSTGNTPISNAEGNSTWAIGNYSHAEGYQTSTTPVVTVDSTTFVVFGIPGNPSSAINVSGSYEDVFGYNQQTYIQILDANFSSVDNDIIISSSYNSIINQTTLYFDAQNPGTYIYAILNTYVDDIATHAEGSQTFATNGGHSEGEGTEARGYASHAEGHKTITKGNYQHAQGQWNIPTTVQGAFFHGNGTSENNRSNLIYAHDSVVEITGSLAITGSLVMSPTSSFVLPLSRSLSPQIGSAYWSGSFLFVYNGTRYMSASFV